MQVKRDFLERRAKSQDSVDRAVRVLRGCPGVQGVVVFGVENMIREQGQLQALLWSQGKFASWLRHMPDLLVLDGRVWGAEVKSSVNIRRDHWISYRDMADCGLDIRIVISRPDFVGIVAVPDVVWIPPTDWVSRYPKPFPITHDGWIHPKLNDPNWTCGREYSTFDGAQYRVIDDTCLFKLWER